MRLPGWRVLAVVGGVGAVVVAPCTQVRADDFPISFAAGSRDDAGRFMGGTEMRVLAAHQGKLYAGNGYWKDRPGAEGLHGAQILVLDSPNAGWRVDHDFDTPLPSGRPRYLATSALYEFRFTTDRQGRPLAEPVSMLATAFWDLTGETQAFTRDDDTGMWSAATLARDRPAPNFLPQLRSFAEHRDRVTEVDLAFAGDNPRGIFSGGYDPAVPGRIRWSTAPELGLSDVPAAGLSGTNAGLRVSSFTEANGRFYAAVGQQIYERIDGPAPRWRLIYTNPRPGHSETGLRGLTAVPTAAGGEALLAAVEGNAPRLVRITPTDGSEVTELNCDDFLARAWRMRPSYVIAAYNDMARLRTSSHGDALLIGLMAFIPRNVPIAAGHRVVDVGYGQVESGAWYLVRWPDGHYDLHQVTAAFGHPLVATRSIRASPFLGESDAVYFAGYDANKAPVHNTAWIARAVLSTALGPSR